jgi:hypothetical protein
MKSEKSICYSVGCSSSQSRSRSVLDTSYASDQAILKVSAWGCLCFPLGGMQWRLVNGGLGQGEVLSISILQCFLIRLAILEGLGLWQFKTQMVVGSLQGVLKQPVVREFDSEVPQSRRSCGVTNLNLKLEAEDSDLAHSEFTTFGTILTLSQPRWPRVSIPSHCSRSISKRCLGSCNH